MTARVRIAFGWIVESRDETPLLIDVPRFVERDVLAHAAEPEGRRRLAALLGIRDQDAASVCEEVLHALGRGRLEYESWSGFRSTGGQTRDVVDLRELVTEEDEVLVTHSVVIELVGEDDAPIPGAAYRLVGPDGRTRRGRLDDEGRAEHHDIAQAGVCKVCFPDFDGEAWEYLSAVPL